MAQANINTFLLIPTITSTQNPKTGKWEILANNKNGSLSYVFKVTLNGDVEFYNSTGQDMRLSIHVDL